MTLNTFPPELLAAQNIKALDLEQLWQAVLYLKKPTGLVIRYGEAGNVFYGLSLNPKYPGSWLESGGSYEENSDNIFKLIESIPMLEIKKTDSYIQASYQNVHYTGQSIMEAGLKLWLACSYQESITLPLSTLPDSLLEQYEGCQVFPVTGNMYAAVFEENDDRPLYRENIKIRF